MKQLKIRLRKCAYIFDDTHSNYTTTRDRERRNAIQGELMKYYNSKELRETWLDAEEKTISTWNGETIKRIYININGLEIPLNALEIAETNRTNDIHNHRRQKTLCGLEGKAFRHHAYEDDSRAYSNKFNTLEIEEFAGPDTLGYYRLHFNGSCVKFIIDERNGDIYTADGIEHKPTTRKALLERLAPKSKAALDEINEIFDYLQN